MSLRKASSSSSDWNMSAAHSAVETMGFALHAAASRSIVTRQVGRRGTGVDPMALGSMLNRTCQLLPVPRNCGLAEQAKGLSFISLMTYDGNMARTTDQTLAREALDALRNCKSVKLSVRGGRTVQVPDSAIDSFLATLEAVADGSTVEVVRTEAEVSTQQAARILNVSRPTAVRLFDTGEIISHKVGSHRRAKLKDVVEYRDAEAQRRRAALDEMVRDAEDSGLYDVEPLPFRR